MIQGKVYKLVNTVDNQIYVGSTVSPLSKRFHGHKTDARKPSTRRVMTHLLSIGWENVRIILIENYTCLSKEELRAREQYYIDLLRPSLNMSLAFDNCPHGRQQCVCKDCGGLSICEHNRHRIQCRECGGSQICEHNRQRNLCKECDGASICKHNRRRIACKDCSPVLCDFCNVSTSKANYKSHLQTNVHKTKYKTEFLRVFDEEINDDDVPDF